ncbi:MAG: hypothetical protein KAG94_06820 [Clostridiales bacterium]|nr:hypothetical protein [Clostridiales bacterium]
MSFFEMTMLLCFGMAWPTSIYKSIKSKSTKGKSVNFLFIILLGYTAGILHKLIYNLDFVIVLYVINFLMVFTDIILYYRNKRFEQVYKP